jgi:hypothetical protein
MRPSSGVTGYTTGAKWGAGVSVVEGTEWVAVVWKRVVAEGVTTVVEGTAWVAVVWKRVEAEGVTTRTIVRRNVCADYNKTL